MRITALSVVSNMVKRATMGERENKAYGMSNAGCRYGMAIRWREKASHKNHGHRAPKGVQKI
jgi:hypothetical protein